MNNKTTPCGLDFGNGFIKLAINGQVSKISSVYGLVKPKGAISPKTGLEQRAKAYSLTVENIELWFGQDVLSGDLIREVDADKYTEFYIKTLFSAALANHVRQHKVSPDEWGKLSIIASMPPSSFEDVGRRKQAIKAYRSVFNGQKTPWYVKSSIADTFRIQTSFVDIYPEAVSYGQAHNLKNLTVILDIGFGTSDYVLLKPNSHKPVISRSVNDTGLMYAFDQPDSLSSVVGEIEYLRPTRNLAPLAAHFSKIKQRLAQMIRRIPSSQPLTLIIVGGGVKLMTKSVKDGFKTMAHTVTFKDEYVNAQSSETLAGAK